MEYISNFPEFKIRAVCADCFFGNKKFTDGINAVCKSQVLSQIRSNQIVYMKGKPIRVDDLFQPLKVYQKPLIVEDKIKKCDHAWYENKGENQWA